MIDPVKHPRRYARWREQQIAERIRALAPSLTISGIAERLSLGRIETEEICARHAIPFKMTTEK